MVVTVVVKHFIVGGKDYVIVQDEDGFYRAIDRENVDESGRITKTLYGHQTFPSKNLNVCLNSVKHHVEIEELMAQGKSRAEAVAITHNLMDKLDELKKIFDGID